MKNYKVCLSSGEVLEIEADRYEAEDGMIRLYHGSRIHAEYQRADVQDIVAAHAIEDTAEPHASLMKPASRLTRH